MTIDNSWLFDDGLAKSAQDMSAWANLIDEPIVLPPINRAHVPEPIQSP